MRGRIILDLCGGTGAWSKPYADAGYDVRVIDPGYGGEDIRLMKVPDDGIHGILAAPPCTMFAISGARWKRTDEQMVEALSVVDACFRIVRVCHPVWWALENPVGKLIHYIGRWRYNFQPYEYGDPWTKRTCMWGRHNIPVKAPVDPVGQWTGHSDTKGIADHPEFLPPDWVHKMPPGPNRQAMRSITPPGFAKAFFEANP